MKKDAEDDKDLKAQALDHAKMLLKEYVLNVGSVLGEDYIVEFVETSDETDDTKVDTEETQANGTIESAPAVSDKENT